jgi:hypothetical protein
VNNGTYQLEGLLPGTYSLIASKDAWSIPSIEVTIVDSDMTGQYFSASPTDWEILRVGGATLRDVISGETVSNSNFKGRMFAAGSMYAAWASSPTSWSTFSDPGSVRELAELSGYMAAIQSDGDLYIDNGGTGWTSYHDLNTSVNAMHLVSETIAAVADTSGNLRYTTNAGSSWNDTYDPSGEYVYDVRRLTSTPDFLVVGSGGYVGHRTSGTWNTRTSNTTDNLLGVEVWGAAGAMAVSSSGRIITTSDSSTWDNWSEDISGIPYTLYSVKKTAGASFPHGALVCGSSGLVLRRK